MFYINYNNNLYIKITIAFNGRHFATSEVIRSKPGDFLFGYFRIEFLTSLRVTYFIGGP